MKDVYFEHYICGIDYRFFLYYEVEDGKVTKFDPTIFRNKYKNLLDEKIITPSEFEEINELIKDNPSVVDMAVKPARVIRRSRDNVVQFNSRFGGVSF